LATPLRGSPALTLEVASSECAFRGYAANARCSEGLFGVDVSSVIGSPEAAKANNAELDFSRVIRVWNVSANGEAWATAIIDSTKAATIPTRAVNPSDRSSEADNPSARNLEAAAAPPSVLNLATAEAPQSVLNLATAAAPQSVLNLATLAESCSTMERWVLNASPTSGATRGFDVTRSGFTDVSTRPVSDLLLKTEPSTDLADMDGTGNVILATMG